MLLLVLRVSIIVLSIKYDFLCVTYLLAYVLFEAGKHGIPFLLGCLPFPGRRKRFSSLVGGSERSELLIACDDTLGNKMYLDI